jgi:acetyl-CoA carboxylase biotin carboxyl carrier protein
MSKQFSVEQIKELVATLGQNKMNLVVKDGDYSIMIESAKEPAVVQQGAAVVAPAPVAVVATAGEVAQVASATSTPVAGNVVKSEIVGVYYESPSPEKGAFVKVGSQVKKGDVLFIIESMKLMNEVTSQHDGIITEILVENSQAVEYGQPVLTIK